MKQFASAMLAAVITFFIIVISLKRTAKMVEVTDDGVVCYRSTIHGDLENRTYYLVPIDCITEFNRQDSIVHYFYGDGKVIRKKVIFH